MTFAMLIGGAIPNLFVLLIPTLLLRFLVFRKVSPPKSFLYSIAVPTPVLPFLAAEASERGFIHHFIEYFIAAIVLGLIYFALYFTVFSKSFINK